VSKDPQDRKEGGLRKKKLLQYETADEGLWLLLHNGYAGLGTV